MTDFATPPRHTFPRWKWIAFGVVAAYLLAAGWSPADALSFHSSLPIALDTVLDKPDPSAPVSNLYLFGRKEDLAFEKPVGHSPRERHHVRFWRSAEMDDGRPMWMGAATHDVGVELSHTDGCLPIANLASTTPGTLP